MRNLIHTLFFTSCLMCFCYSSFAQVQAVSVKQGPAGIFLFLGKEIPSGKSISSYRIERSADHINWKQIAEVRTPLTFDAFSKALDDSKKFFPSQPLPPSDKLIQLYQRAVVAGNTDSLKGMRLLLPIRMALGIMYYDTAAKQHIAYSYKVSTVKLSGDLSLNFTSDTVSLPFRPKFDTIRYSESSYNPNSVVIRWKSIGKNPAPLFMVYKFRFGAAVVAHGKTSRFEVNDTTYYAYRDTTLGAEAGKEMQFFVSPYDYYGNSGLSSQVAVITQDNFNKAGFVRDHIEFMPKLAGNQICWHFTDPVTVKTFEIYRSESSNTGFRKLSEVASADTSYLDQQIGPEKIYYYYVQVVAKAGKRTKQTEVLMVRVPGTGTSEKLNSPRLLQVAVVNNAVRLLVIVNDTAAESLRFFRGTKDGLVVLPVTIKTGKSVVIAFTDTTLPAKERKDVFYAVRNEKEGVGISGLSGQMPVALVADPNDVGYFYAIPSNGRTELYWDDVTGRKGKYTSYTLARQTGPANSKSPLKILAENLIESSFTDLTATDGNQFTYVLRLVDKAGEFSDKSWKITTQGTK